MTRPEIPIKDAATIIAAPMKPFLSIIIPIYNAGPDLKKNLEKVLRYIDRKDFPIEVILVNDGSSDNTPADLRSIRDPRVRLIDNPKNMGKGYSVKRGMLEGQGEYLVFFDADIAYPVEQVDLLVNGLKEGYDIAIGSRVHKDSRFILHCEDLRYIFRRHLLSRAFNLFLRLTLIKDLRDTQSGFKGFKKKAAEYVFSRQRSNDFSFDIEILFLAQKAGLKVKEVPVMMEYQGGPSAVSMFRDSFAMFTKVSKVWYWYLTGAYR